jgi:lipopolysaccharide export system permease protein
LSVQDKVLLILERYIAREITAPLVSVCTVLILIFSGYSAVGFLNDAVNGLLSGETVVVLVALKVLIALEVLIPVTLYLAVVLALARLHGDSEITAMESVGIGQGRIITPVLSLALLLAIMVAGLSLYARPLAYQKMYSLENIGHNEFDIAKVEAGRFYEMGDNLVFFAEELYPDKKQARNVWIWELVHGKREVTTAENAYQINGPEERQKSIVLQNGYHYVLNLGTGGDHIIQFQENAIHLKSVRNGTAKYRRKAASSGHLAGSSNPKDIAEFQWRLSTALSTVLMALLAIPLSRVAPRRSKYGKVTAAIILFFVFYNLSLIAKTWVEKGVVGTLPGIWWVNALLALLIMLLLPFPTPIQRIVRRCSRRNGGTGS